MNFQKFELIKIKFISHNKFSLKRGNGVSKKILKLLLIFWLLKKYKNIISVKFKGLKNNYKFFTLLKSPKCYKRGKLILRYQVYKYLIILKKKIYFTKNLNDIFNYFKYYIYMLKFFDSNFILNNKIKLLTYTNIF